MKKVQIINNVNSRQFGAQFDSEEEMNAWIESCQSKNTWGLPDRWLSETDGSHTNERQVLIQEAQEERTVQRAVLDSEGNEQYEEVTEIDENGDEIAVQKLITENITLPAIEAVYETEYFFPCEYTIEVIDVTEEYGRKARLAQARQDVAKNLSDLQFGTSIIALVGMMNDSKDLTHGQKDAMLADSAIQLIMLQLQAGRIGRAKQLVEAYEVDGVMLTQNDKDLIVQLIEDYLESRD